MRNLPALWGHPKVTDLERKEILACVIDMVTLTVDDEEIHGTLRWRTGEECEIRILRRAGMHRLVLALHAEGLTVPQIDQCLRQPHPETGQTWSYNRSAIHGIIRRAGLKPHSSRVMSAEAAEQLRRLQDSGLTHRQTAEALNDLGIRTAHGRSWSEHSVRAAYRVLGAPPRLVRRRLGKAA